jgi:hypothetical protein
MAYILAAEEERASGTPSSLDLSTTNICFLPLSRSSTPLVFTNVCTYLFGLSLVFLSEASIAR